MNPAVTTVPNTTAAAPVSTRTATHAGMWRARRWTAGQASAAITDASTNHISGCAARMTTPASSTNTPTMTTVRMMEPGVRRSVGVVLGAVMTGS